MSENSGKLWAAVPAVLLCTLTGSLGLVAYLTSNDPSFAIERNYYDKALHFEQSQRQAETNARLGWHVALETVAVGSRVELRAQVKDANGRVIPDAAIAVEGFANARASEVMTARFARAPGEPQRAELPLSKSGLWELRFTVDARGERFTQTIRRDIEGSGS